MRAKNSEEVAKRVCQRYEKLCFRDRKNTRHFFLNEGMHRNSIDRILDIYDERGNVDFKKSVGRPALLGSKKVVTRVEKAFLKNPNTSDSAVAAKVGLSRSYVQKIKSHKLCFKRYKAQTAQITTKVKNTELKPTVEKFMKKCSSKAPPSSSSWMTKRTALWNPKVLMM